MKRNSLFFLPFIVIILLNSYQAFAQCGASLSSCKTCHEVKRAKPVATQGSWHKDHAFGDFCEFCHEGNTAAKDEASAHAGINLMPLKNPGNTCSSCHPDDYKSRAQKYAAILKIDISDEGNQPVTQAASQDSAAQATPEPTSTAAANPGATISIPAGGEVVDFNQILAEEPPSHIAVGNLILIVMIAGLFFAFLFLYWFFNKASLKKKFREIAHGTSEEISPAASLSDDEDLAEAISIIQSRPLIHDLVLQLKDRDPVTIEALLKICSLNGSAEKLIKSLGHLDLELFRDLQGKNERELEVLMTLAKKL